mmetsp:Transcript_11448/g.29764  ORF Transcript_11448/g.29764 Transcript_11448/m.29764 type:complete len:464 (+) Transcript_11448:56-1447(+)
MTTLATTEATGVTDSTRLRKLTGLINAPAFRSQSDGRVQLREQLRALALDGSPPLHSSELRMLSKLGEGAFAEVELCEVASVAMPRFGASLASAPRGPSGGALVAVKWLRTHAIADPCSLAPTAREHVELPAHEESNFFAEAALLRSVRHPSIVAAHGCYVFEHAGAIPQAQPRPAIILDYALGGTIYSRVRHGVGYSCAEALTWLSDLAGALAFLHEAVGHSTIVHRDIKPENVLIDADGRAKLADFGLFRALPAAHNGAGGNVGPLCSPRSVAGIHELFTTDSAGISQPLGTLDIRHANVTGRTGSSRYMAPEVWRSEPYSQRVDVFSFGILAWEVLCSQRAYTDRLFTCDQIAEYVATQNLRPKLPAKWPAELRELVSRCWAADSSERPSMSRVVTELKMLRVRVEAEHVPAEFACVLAPRVSRIAAIQRKFAGTFRRRASVPSVGPSAAVHTFRRRATV